MFTRTGKWVPLTAIGLFPLIVGCDGGSFSLAYHDDRPVRRVYVDPGSVHVCTHGCHHHYWDGGRLVVLNGHRHGPGCGHHFDGKYWVRVSARGARVHVDAGPIHVCSHNCHHHYWDGGKLVVLTGHRHGPGCGHVFKSNRWLVMGKSPAVHHRNSPRVHPRKAPAVHVRKGPAVHVQKGPKRVKKAKHVHGPGCGHVRVNGEWVKRR